MSSTTDKIKGMANEAAGAVKQSAGKAVGNPNLEVKGTLQKGKGEAQQAWQSQGCRQESHRQGLS